MGSEAINKIAQLELSPRQIMAYEILQDKETNEIFYGGAAGGGKSALGCIWLITSCIVYPGSRWLMGRAVLKNLKDSTLLIFLKFLKDFGLKGGRDYVYNSMAGVIKFSNGSEVYLKDLFLYPSDPEFDSLGSTEYTGAFIDEASQVTEKAYNIVKSRIRYRHQEFNTISKILIASNPCKTFLYEYYYKPWKEGKLPKNRKFIQAFVQDNQFLPEEYQEALRGLDERSKQRLLYGNWEYDDDPSKLFEYERIMDMFTLGEQRTGVKYLSVDVARFGADKIVIVLWDGLHVENIYVYSHQSTKDTEEKIEEIRNKYSIPRSRVVIDEDGIGGGCVDHLTGVKGFVNNGKAHESVTVKKKEGIKQEAIKVHNFGNLKAQCYFKLSDLVSQGKISIYKDIPVEYKKLLIGDLEQIRRKDPDKELKLYIVPKEEIKERLGRSTDFSDAVMMRMLFEVKPAHGFAV